MCARSRARARAPVFESVRACFYVLGTTALTRSICYGAACAGCRKPSGAAGMCVNGRGLRSFADRAGTPPPACEADARNGGPAPGNYGPARANTDVDVGQNRS